MKILGIVVYYYDVLVVVIVDGKVVVVVQEEWFICIKYDLVFFDYVICWVMDYVGLELSDIDVIVFYDKFLLKFECLLEIYYCYVFSGVWSFFWVMFVWVKEKVFLKQEICKLL